MTTADTLIGLLQFVGSTKSAKRNFVQSKPNNLSKIRTIHFTWNLEYYFGQANVLTCHLSSYVELGYSRVWKHLSVHCCPQNQCQLYRAPFKSWSNVINYPNLMWLTKPKLNPLWVILCCIPLESSANLFGYSPENWGRGKCSCSEVRILPESWTLLLSTSSLYSFL